MSTSFQIEKDGEVTRVYLTKSLDTRGKILYLSIAIFYEITGLLVLLMILLSDDFSSSFLFVFVMVFLLLQVLVVKYINRATESEMLIVNGDSMTIYEKALFKSKLHEFKLSKISQFKHLPEQYSADHPLKGDSFDYFGFQTEQKVIDNLNADGRIGFLYEGRVVRFGKDLASWEFEELEILLYDISGNDLRYTDDFESQHFS